MARRLASTLVALALLASIRSGAAQAADIRPFAPADVLTLAGDPETIGRLHGEALKPEIQRLIDQWLVPRLSTVPWIIDWFARAKLRNMAPFISPDMRREIEATAAAAEVDPTMLMIGNAAPDIMELAQKPFGCSTFVVLPSRAATGGMIYGRNLDYRDSDLLRSHWRPTVFASPGKLKVLSLNLPGLSGVLTAVNERGVMMSRTTSYSREMTSRGMPSMLLFREILQVATTAAEAEALYRAAARTVAVNVMITDAREALLLEATADRVITRRPNASGLLYAANHYESDELKSDRHTRDERWDALSSRDGDARPVTADEVRDVIARTGWETGNVLATVMDYGRGTLLFGSDPEGNGRSAAGTLWELDLAAAFGQ